MTRAQDQGVRLDRLRERARPFGLWIYNYPSKFGGRLTVEAVSAPEIPIMTADYGRMGSTSFELAFARCNEYVTKVEKGEA